MKMKNILKVILFMFAFLTIKAQDEIIIKPYNTKYNFKRYDSTTQMIYYKSISEIIAETDTNIWQHTVIRDKQDVLVSEFKYDGKHIHVNAYDTYYKKYAYERHCRYTLIMKDSLLVYDGAYSCFFPDYDTLETGNFSLGKHIGVWKRYSKGQLIKIKEYFETPDENYKVTRYFNNGNISSTWKVKNKMVDDSVYSFYSDGSIRVKGCYKAGKRTGEWKFYHQNGNLGFKGTYSEASEYDSDWVIQKRKGVWRFYDEEGKLGRKDTYSKKGNLKCVKFYSPSYNPNFSQLYYKPVITIKMTGKGVLRLYDNNRKLARKDVHSKKGKLKRVRFYNDFPIFVPSADFYENNNGVFSDNLY